MVGMMITRGLQNDQNSDWTFGKAPDCLDSQACVPVSNLADSAWGFFREMFLFFPPQCDRAITLMAASSS